MAIRIVLNEQADIALKNAVTKLKKANPQLCKFQNALVSAAVIGLAENLNENNMKALMEKLLSRSAKRKVIFSKVGVLLQNLDDSSLKSFEGTVSRMYGHLEKNEATHKSQSVEGRESTTVGDINAK